MSIHDEMDAGAAVAARALGMGATLFKSLPVGARFVFRLGDPPLVRTARGYRQATGGRQFTTGARTACFRLDD